MIKIILLLALCGVAFAGYGNYHLGYGFTAGGGYPHYPSHYGYRHGVAHVQHHQTPYNYNFNVQEHGKGYNKYHHQSADTHGHFPVYGYGHGHY